MDGLRNIVAALAVVILATALATIVIARGRLFGKLKSAAEESVADWNLGRLGENVATQMREDDLCDAPFRHAALEGAQAVIHLATVPGGAAEADPELARRITDANGNVLATIKYDEYGVGSGGSGRFRYTGQAYIPEIGLYYYKARMYSPAVGRFMPNTPPVANSDTKSVSCQQLASVNVTANDTDVDGDYPLTLTSVVLTSGATGGISLDIESASSVANEAFQPGQFIATYTIRDSRNATDTGTLTINVSPSTCY